MADPIDYSDFIKLNPTQGRGFLTVYTPDGRTYCFNELDLDLITVVCPLLALSFEEGPRGRQLHSLQASSVELVSRFLRFLYTGHYDILDSLGNQLPVSLLTHAQLYHYADLYDVAHLLDSAYYNITCELEVVCSLPNPHADLCEAIKFIYEHYKNGLEVREAFLHYCVNCFVYHRLGQMEDFRQLLSEQKTFQQDLFRINMERGFQDEGSSNLIQLQLPKGSRASEIPMGDYLYEMFGSNNSTPFQTPLLSPTRPSPEPSFSLVHRPRHPGKMPSTDSDGYSSEGSIFSDLEGFSLVGRPKTSFPSYDRTSRNPKRDPFADPSDSDSSDSNWSVLSDGAPKEKPVTRSLLGEALAQERASVTNGGGVDYPWADFKPSGHASTIPSLYSRPDLAGSAETVVAVEEKQKDSDDEGKTRNVEQAGDAEKDDNGDDDFSEWECEWDDGAYDGADDGASMFVHY